MLREFLPPESAVVFVPKGAGVTDAQIAGRFDTPLDESFDELHALAVVYVFQAGPERYAALDVRSVMMTPTTAFTYRTQGVTLREDEAPAVQALAKALNSQRQKLLQSIDAAKTNPVEQFKRRMDAYRWLVSHNHGAFFPPLLSARSVVFATVMYAPLGAPALMGLMSKTARAFLSAASEDLMYVGVCIVCAVRVLPTTLSAPSVARCFVSSAVAAVLPGLVHRNWVLEILKMLRTASELAASPLVGKAVGERWAPLVTWLSALVNNDAMECLVGLLVGRAFGVHRAISDEVGLKCADVLVAKSAGVLPPWVTHILDVGLDVYKLYKVAEAAAFVIDTQKSDSLIPVLPANRMGGLVAQLEAKFGLPAYVPKKLARSLMVAAATAAVYSHEGDRALERVLTALLSSQPGAASELVRCLLRGGSNSAAMGPTVILL
jgi:hypothetical protein